MQISRVRTVAAAVFASVGIFFLGLVIISAVVSGNPRLEVAAVQAKISFRLDRLESYALRPGADLPEDMVIYRYRDGKLLHWHNQFPLPYDGDVVKDVVLNPSYRLYSFSGNLYLARRADSDGWSDVLGYRIGKDDRIESAGFLGGLPVRYDGQTLFKFCHQDVKFYENLDLHWLWIAYVCLIAAVLIFMRSRPGLRRMQLSIFLIFAVSAAMFAGLSLMSQGEEFRIQTVGLLNVVIFAVMFCHAAARESLSAGIRPVGPVTRRILCGALIAAMLLYVHFSLRYLILNTDSVLAFVNMSEMKLRDFWIILSYLLAMSMISFLTQLGFRKMSMWEQLVLSMVLSVYLVGATSLFGLRKESGTLKVTSAALALNRDLNVEAMLLKAEKQMQKDSFLVRAVFTPQYYSAENYLNQSYLYDISSRFETSAFTMEDDRAEWMSSMEKNMVRIAPESRFYHVRKYGVSRYMALFPFSRGSEIRYLMVVMDQKTLVSSSRQTELHPKYSYAIYRDGRLASFRGKYAYPVLMTETMHRDIRYRHFIYDFGGKDQIIVSRTRIGPEFYVTSIILCSMIYLVILMLAGFCQRFGLLGRKEYFERNMLVLSESLVMTTLIIIFAISVFFIVSNNRSVVRTMIAERISTLQMAVQKDLTLSGDLDSMNMPEIGETLKEVSKITESVLTLYSSEGQQLVATRQLVVNGMPSYRIPEDIRDRIVGDKVRYAFRRSRSEPFIRYEMYAPLIGSDGRIAAILHSPYYGVETFEVGNNATMHIITLLSFLVILLVLAQYITERFYMRMLSPLKILSGKMHDASLTGMERIEYDRNDEIRYLVDSYNLMADQLERSTAQLAEAERNQAWTGMARQVAHEIKNPLTPMKLQIQRIMRLKEKGDPSWPQKMEEASSILLNHITVLAKTADEFSSFAKMFSESSSDINLDSLLRRELAMYSCREDISFECSCPADARISGPEPQITRVFVNLINNSIQALDSVAGADLKRISINVHHSGSPGVLEITIQDSGPGVSEENVGKLFTPNFTTRSGGSGLGLAISKSVLDKCGATISYSRSTELGGACFTILYPCAAAPEN